MSGVPEGFPRFTYLPAEVRLLIWKCSLPDRDVKIGRITLCPATMSAATHNRQDCEFDEQPHLRPSRILSQVCRESREFAWAASGVFYDTGGEHAMWIDNDARTVYTSTEAVEDSPPPPFPKSFHALACLWPTVEDLKVFHDFLLKRSENVVYPTTEIMYACISPIIYDDTLNDASLDSIYNESDVSVFELDDPRLPAFLQSAFEAAKGRREPGLYHRSPSCYLRNLKRYWEAASAAQGLQTYWHTEAWEDVESDAVSASVSQKQHQRQHFPKLKPAVIFGKTGKDLFFQMSVDTRVHERGCDLLFTKDDCHPIRNREGNAQWLARIDTMFKCENMCR
ncbi:hypothetical protein AK830_g4091 [Neonectria ditissima]|uniref:2EXR domain-containing protein n=1 Tax=Neonectria ditissima TaxID=78410 RepID=A0A0P7B7A4_9HYPO|nr:hypothetical protein AK830_g4091 [Neonectria ditissima]